MTHAQRVQFAQVENKLNEALARRERLQSASQLAGIECANRDVTTWRMCLNSLERLYGLA